MHRHGAPSYDVARMQEDMAANGLLPIDVARHAHISHMTVSRFLSGERQTARMAKKIAVAIGYSVRRYLISSSTRAVA